MKLHMRAAQLLSLLALLVCVGVAVALCMGAFSGPEGRAAAPTPAVTPAPVTPAPVPTPTPTPRPSYDFSRPAPATAPVGEDYFTDALFIGDSRSDGLRLYSGIKDADFLAYKALMVFEVTGTHSVERKKIPVGKEKMTVLDAVERKQYGKIYIMLGVNELGWNQPAAFEEAFGILIDELRTRQPDAVIYIQSLIPVNPDKCLKSKSPAYITNENIAVYNQVLARVAQTKKTVYLDVSAGLLDENGVLPAEGSTDGIHLTRGWYEKWLTNLRTHGVDSALYFESQGDDSNA